MSGLKFDFGGVGDLGGFGVFDFEILADLETETLGDHIAGKYFHFNIKFFGAGVVEATSGLDFVLNVLKLFLELFEVLVGLELGIRFGNGKDFREAGGKRVFGGGGSLNVFCAHGLAASFGDVFESFFFVLGVAFDGFDDVRDEIGAVFELDGDITPSFVDLLVELDEAVVSAPDDRNEYHHDASDNDENYFYRHVPP